MIQSILTITITAAVSAAHLSPVGFAPRVGLAPHAAVQTGQAQTPPPAETAPPLNLNTATQQQLEKLPGIGPAVAQRILEHRQKNGPFKKVEDLMNVQGIGEKTFLRLKPLVTVAPPKAEPR
jgi:competence protein ComEA